MDFTSRVLIVPGLGNSGEQHWQSLWERQFPNFERVGQTEWDAPVCEDWISKLDQVVMVGDPSTVLLVGHSLACSTIAYWANTFQRPIKGALLVAPSDTEADSYPSGTIGFSPVPLSKLPFPSIVVASTDDFYVSLGRATLFARAWGSELVNIGSAGHVNVASGYGDWPEGLALLKKLD
ncbi:RBBP9/YdeN family alpha/beta hydrolase [Spirosoma foliorum]|uniref:Serine hydrolase family protein n=1 Tax=Spirosoma foliorum TaxID=2710596 RepID=A0A7G5H005_9BACT|nr:alpha/beta hydrolase [Spirosoma foliorum]QMW04447.1 serine hydrolase family protein [Spirosoma foliorum]